MILLENVSYAFILTLVAGLSTGVGSLIAYFFKKPKMSYLSVGLGLSAGVMAYVSFVELLPEGIESLGEVWGVIIFFFGIGFIMLIDFIIPEIENPHHPVNIEENEVVTSKRDDNSQSIQEKNL